VVGVAVEDRGDGVAVQRLFEAAGAEEGHDLGRLSFHGGSNRAVMEHGHALDGAQARERALELDRLLGGLVDEVLEALLAPRLERSLAEAAHVAFDACKAHAVQLDAVAVENVDAGRREDLLYLLRAARLVVVVSEHSDDGDALGGLQLGDQQMRLLRQAVVGQIPA
jgi:hypothetical protein